MSYIGRFAPSPTGPLHFGSLVAALASYLDAKAHQGKWLLRNENIDTPRCQPHAFKDICATLIAHGMQWDNTPLVQSSRADVYEHTLTRLLHNKRAYYCNCTRQSIRKNKGVHPVSCRTNQATHGAIRLINNQPVSTFLDRFLGRVVVTDAHALDDPVLKRRDQLYAYNLAVVVDDSFQGVTHVVRGDDLLDTTSAHLTLYKELGQSAPVYLHIPVIKDSTGNKLSKQNHAPSIDNAAAKHNLIAALKALNVQITTQMQNTSIPDLLGFATCEWRKKLDLLGA